MVGDTVRLVNDHTYLTLCEVRVWGDQDPVSSEPPGGQVRVKLTRDNDI